jgi:hypothetical protein
LRSCGVGPVRPEPGGGVMGILMKKKAMRT